MYYSFIFRYLIYCIKIWGSASDALLLPLIILQNKIVRVISFSLYLAHTKEIFLKLNNLPFKDLVVHRIGIQMFKNKLLVFFPMPLKIFSLLTLQYIITAPPDELFISRVYGDNNIIDLELTSHYEARNRYKK